MDDVDVIVLTKNSGYLLDKCFESVYENVPVRNLIVVDGYSTDDTMKIVDKTNVKHGNVTVLKLNGSRAKAREAGIRQVETDWFMFVDSDVILGKDWFRKAKKSVQKDVGAVWGVNIDIIPNVSKDRRFVKLQNLIARQCFYLRGGMHDTLIRRDAVKGIRIPNELHIYEDAYIIDWIKQNGFRAVIDDEAYCLHYKPPNNWNLENGVSEAILELRCGLMYSHNYENVAYYPFFMFQWFMHLSMQGLNGLISR
ncbi:MAG TPA: glycosyltransferase family 2 protein [Candidatus Bathyarchaeia archaeon]